MVTVDNKPPGPGSSTPRAQGKQIAQICGSMGDTVVQHRAAPIGGSARDPHLVSLGREDSDARYLAAIGDGAYHGEGSVRVQRHVPTAVLPDDRTALCLERLRRSFQQYQGISPRLRESAVHLLIGDHRKFAVIHYQAPIESADCLADVLASPTLHSAGRQMIRAVSVWWPGDQSMGVDDDQGEGDAGVLGVKHFPSAG